MKIRERSERKLIPFSILYGTGQDNPVMGGRGEWGGGEFTQVAWSGVATLQRLVIFNVCLRPACFVFRWCGLK